VSTKEDLQSILGSPKKIVASDSQNPQFQTWVYTYAKYSSDPHTGVPPIGMTSVPISRNRRRTHEIEITFNQKGVVIAVQEKSVP